MFSRLVKIGILGDFNPGYHTHHATNASLRHAAQALGCEVEMAWVPTPSLESPHAVDRLEGYDGLWASPGSPYRSMCGMLAGIEYARTRNRPFLAT
jgi:CTP synthase (UTP-ammonia lyase)